MHYYPSYRLEDFYQKSFKQGGLTAGQINVLYGNYIKQINSEFKFQAALQGIDLDKTGKSTSRVTPKQSSTNALPLFGSPEDYAHLSEEERQEMTQKMMGKHKSWVQKTVPKSITR
jgi:hypothetical protein